MANTYYLLLSDGTVDLQVEEGTVVDKHGLRFDGFQKPSYSDRRNNNILHLAENFASEEDAGNPGNPLPSVISDPVLSQFWFDKTANELKMWNGVAWVAIGSDVFAFNAIPVLDGTPSNQLTLQKNSGGDVIIDNIASLNDLNAHINDLVDAHDASAIFFNDTGSIPGDNVQDAIEDVQGNLDAHLLDAVDAHDASAISFVPYGSVGSTTVQAAIAELEVELNSSNTNANTINTTLNNHIADLVDAHDASAISFNGVPSGFAAIDVQDALEELVASVGGGGNQSVIDSLRVTRSGAQSLTVDTITKVLFNLVQFGDDFGQFNTVTNRYTAQFHQIVRVRAYVGVSSINDESRMGVYIRKNGVDQRYVEEWLWSETDDLPGDKEASCILELLTNDYVDVHVIRYSGGGAVSVDTATSRTALEIDIIKAIGTPPVLSDVRLSDQAISIDGVGSSSASITVLSNGDLSALGAVSPGFNSDEWHVTNPSVGIGNLYQVRLVTVGGTLTSGTADTWLNLSSDRTFGMSQVGIGSNVFNGVLQIRDIATMTIQDQANVSITASVSK